MSTLAIILTTIASCLLYFTMGMGTAKLEASARNRKLDPLTTVLWPFALLTFCFIEIVRRKD